MVNKLGLKRYPHPNPYKVSWLSKEQQVVVHEQVNVEFQIGEYKDKIDYDVVEMDACHLLLGRPWQYDVNSKHDGRSNVYIISKNGKEDTMRPLPKDGKETRHASSVMMVGEEEFLKTLKVRNTPFFAIVVKQKLGDKEKGGRLDERNVEPKEVR